MAAGAQGELAEVAPHVSTPPPPPDPPRAAAPPPPKSPPPRSPPPPPPQVQPRGGDVMDSFTALAAPFDEPPRRQEDAMEGGMGGIMGGIMGGAMGGPGGESFHSNSTADSLWDALGDSASTALPSHDTHSVSPAASAASHPADTFSPPTAVLPTTPPRAPTGEPPLSPQQRMKAAAAPPGGGASPPQAHAKGPPPPPAKLDAGVCTSVRASPAGEWWRRACVRARVRACTPLLVGAAGEWWRRVCVCVCACVRVLRCWQVVAVYACLHTCMCMSCIRPHSQLEYGHTITLRISRHTHKHTHTHTGQTCSMRLQLMA